MILRRLHSSILDETLELRKKECQHLETYKKKGAKNRIFAFLIVITYLLLMCLAINNTTAKTVGWTIIVLSMIIILILTFNKKFTRWMGRKTGNTRYYVEPTEASNFANQICKNFVQNVCEKAIPYFSDYYYHYDGKGKRQLDEMIKTYLFTNLQHAKLARYEYENPVYDFSISKDLKLDNADRFLVLKSIEVDTPRHSDGLKVGVHFTLQKYQNPIECWNKNKEPKVIVYSSETHAITYKISVILDENEIVNSLQ